MPRLRPVARHAALASAVAAIGAATIGTTVPTPLTAQATPLALDDLLDVRNTAAGALSDDGRWLLATMSRPRTSMGVDYNRSFGDPTYTAPTKRESFIVDTQTGDRVPLFTDLRMIGGSAWAPGGNTIAVLVHAGDPALDDRYDLLLVDRASRKATPIRFPAGRYAFERSRLQWSADGRQLFVSLRSTTWRTAARAEFTRLTDGPRIVQSSDEPFLAWNGMQRMGTTESVVAVDRATAKASDLLPEAMRQQWSVTRDGRTVVYTQDITKKTDYDVIGGTEQRLLARDVHGTSETVVFPTLRNIRLVWARDGRRYAFTRDDQLWVSTLGDTARVRLAGDTANRADTTTEARARRGRERFTPISWVESDQPLLVASNPEGLWLIDPATRARTMMVRAVDSLAALPRVQFIGATANGTQLLLALQSKTSWQRAIARFDRTTNRLDTLLRDTRHLASFTMAENGSTVIVSGGEGNRPYDLWALRAPFTSLTRLTNANPTLASRSIGRTELLQYLDADGKSEYGVVHYPAGFTRGKPYPTVFIIYEDFFADTWDAVANLLNANGYVVVKPSVRFDIGYPGEAWVKGVTAAANKLIEMGVADSTRLGVHGTSYGGYATNLLITQTNRFKAAVNISGKVDMISFYTDSPRLGVRNVHAAEKSQDRLGATLWQQPQKYVAHSAVMFADRITTPLLLMTGELDANVPALNTREMYYALRRLNKPVTWVTYSKGGHGTPLSSLDDWTDFHQRLLAWYAKHLKPDAVQP